jgi:hypothetical protein
MSLGRVLRLAVLRHGVEPDVIGRVGLISRDEEDLISFRKE